MMAESISHGIAGSEAPASDLDPNNMNAQEQPLGRTQLILEQTTTPRLPEPEDQHDANDGYSSSEMDISMPASPMDISRPASPIQEISIHAGSKRRMSDAEDDDDLMDQDVEDLIKKRKLSSHDEMSPAECLPTQLWQQVFLYLSPVMLSRCLRVSKAFNTCLTTTRAPLVTPKVTIGSVTRNMTIAVHSIDSNAIWLQAKNAYFPGMPKILEDWTVLRMLQLLGGTTCQFCSKHPLPMPNLSVFKAGPGSAGVRIIWPFLIRACGICWLKNTRTVSLADRVRMAPTDIFVVGRSPSIASWPVVRWTTACFPY